MYLTASHKNSVLVTKCAYLKELCISDERYISQKHPAL
jgi:hypothetical protein